MSNCSHGLGSRFECFARAVVLAAVAFGVNGGGASVAAGTLAPNNPFAGLRAFALGELRADAVRVEVQGRSMLIRFDTAMQTQLQADVWNRLHDCYPQFAFAMGRERNGAEPIDAVVNSMEPITPHGRGAWHGVTVEVDVTVGTDPSRQDRLRIRFDLQGIYAGGRSTDVAIAWPIADAIGRHLVQRTGVGEADVRTAACPAP